MKHFLLATALFISFTGVHSQSANEEAVKKLVHALLLSFEKNDATAAQSLISDSYQMEGHSEVTCIKNKAQRLAAIQSGQIKYAPIDFENKQNHLYIMTDTTAAILGQITTVTYKVCDNTAKEYTTRISRTNVLLFIKRNESWLLSSECIGRNCVH